MTLTENRLKRYNNLFKKNSLYIYSVPKYNAKLAKNNTKIEESRLRESKQKVKDESNKSNEKYHLPKSIK